jgi:hypothetical protein
MEAPILTRIEDYEIFYDGQNASQSAHIFERIANHPTIPTALCGAVRPASSRLSQQGTRPPNPICLHCERLLTQRDGQPLHPARRP